MDELRSCRICLQPGSNLFSIFNIKNKEYLPAVVHNISGVKILKRLEPDAKICTFCETAVISAQNIILRCQETEEILSSQNLVEYGSQNVHNKEECESFSQIIGSMNSENRSDSSINTANEEHAIQNDYKEEDCGSLSSMHSASTADEEYTMQNDHKEDGLFSQLQVLLIKRKSELSAEENNEEDQTWEIESSQPSNLSSPKETQMRNTSTKLDVEIYNTRLEKSVTVNFSCEFCGFHTTVGRNLIEHKLQTHNIVDRKIYKCSHCTERFDWKPKLHRHIEEVHEIIPEDKRFFCNECGSAYTRKAHLIEHKKQRHGPRRFRCPQPDCGITFSRAFTLRRHFLSAHSEEARYNCSECDKYFKSYDVWKYHNEVVHKNNTVYCPKCGYPFRQMKKLEDHLQNEVCKRSVIPCPYCQRRFTAKTGLRSHMKRIHKLP